MILLEEDTGQPAWVRVVRPGPAGDVRLPPVDAWVEGTDVVLPFWGSVVNDAPVVVDPRTMNSAEEDVTSTLPVQREELPVEPILLTVRVRMETVQVGADLQAEHLELVHDPAAPPVPR